MGTIVVGVDSSDGARRALEWAIGEARTHGSKVVAVHTWNVPIAPVGPGVAAVSFDSDDFRAAGQQAFDAAMQGVSAEGVELEQRLVEGSPANGLMDVAREERADLLVVGTRGHGGFTGLLLGSVSSTLAHHSPVPLVIVPPADRK